MPNILFFFFFSFSFFFFISLFSSVSSSERNRDKIPLFIFGDSFLDVGNNNYINTTTLDQANFWPYGETFFKFPTGRFSDGRLISDFIAEYANLPLIPAYLQPGNSNYENGVNFASSGAGALLQTFQGSVIPLKTQAAKYFNEVVSRLRKELGNSEAERIISRSVYLFGIGSNDYLSPFLTSSHLLQSYSKPQYVNMVISNFSTVIKGIYKSGARKFGFINLPPLGCLPGIRVLSNDSSSNNNNCFQHPLSVLANMHNQALSRLLSHLHNHLNDFNYSLYDFHSDITQRINHPSQYGLKEVTSACCGSGRYRGEFSCGGKRGKKEFELCEKVSEYLFWDSYHLTEFAYNQFASQMWDHPYSHTHTLTLKDLFQ